MKRLKINYTYGSFEETISKCDSDEFLEKDEKVLIKGVVDDYEIEVWYQSQRTCSIGISNKSKETGKLIELSTEENLFKDIRDSIIRDESQYHYEDCENLISPNGGFLNNFNDIRFLLTEPNKTYFRVEDKELGLIRVYTEGYNELFLNVNFNSDSRIKITEEDLELWDSAKSIYRFMISKSCNNCLEGLVRELDKNPGILHKIDQREINLKTLNSFSNNKNIEPVKDTYTISEISKMFDCSTEEVLDKIKLMKSEE